MRIKKLQPLGAEITDVDLSCDLSESNRKLIKEAFLDNLVLIFKEQSLEPKNLFLAASLWGPPEKHPVFQGLDEHPEIIKIENFC